jgi:cold shock CspA family protein
MEQQKEYKKAITGKIIYLHPKGWGYINSHEIEFSKVYFHWTGLHNNLNFKTLQKNDVVKFNALKREKGWKAINIEAYNEQEQTG